MCSQSNMIIRLPHRGTGRDPGRSAGSVRVLQSPTRSAALARCASGAPLAPSPVLRERGYGRRPSSTLDQRAFVAAGALERLLAGDRRDLLVIIPRALRLGRLFDLEQIHVADQPPVFEDLAVLGHEVVDRGFPHLFDDGRPVVAAGRLDCIEVVHYRAVDPSPDHGGPPVYFFDEPLRPGAGLVV